MVISLLTSLLTVATTITKSLAVAGLAVQGLKAVGNILTSIGKALGLIKPETTVEDLGDKALQSGYDPEDFDCYDEYVKAVEEFETDPERSKEIKPEDKLNEGIKLAGCLAADKGYPVESFMSDIVAGKRDFFTDSKWSALEKNLSADKQSINDLLGFVSGDLKDSNKVKEMSDNLIASVKSENPKISDTDAYKTVMQIRG